MNSTVKLSQIIGTLADQKEDIVNYGPEDINNSVEELLVRDLNDSDGSNVRVYDVLGNALQNIHLSEPLVAKVIYKLLKNPTKPYGQKKIRGYWPMALNHPNISQMDYVNLLSGYLKSGFWLSKDYSHHLVKHENNTWHPDNILNAIILNIPSLRDCLNDDAIRDEGIDYFINQFLKVFSQLIDVNDEKVQIAFSQLFSKCGPQRIRRLNSPRETQVITELNSKWGNTFLNIKNNFLELFNKLPYDPSPYGRP